MATLGDLVVRIVGDNKELDSAIDSSQKKLQDFGKAAENVGKKLTTFVTLPILGIGAAFLKTASDAEETNAKFDAVFKEQAAEVREWAQEFSSAVGRASIENVKFLATIQDTLVPLGFARTAASDMSRQVVELATDLSSFNNLPTEQVINDIQSALVGNTETLRKYGVVASQAAIEQEALTSGLVDNKNEIDANVKAQAILQLIIKGTADAQGDALRTAGSFANQFRSLQAAAVDVATSFGEILIPAATRLVQMVRDTLSSFNALNDGQKQTILIVAGVAAAIGPLVLAVGKAITIFGALKAAIIAINTTALFGPVGIIVGIAAVTAALIGLGVARRQSQLEEIAEEFADVASAAELATEEIEAIETALRLGSFDGFTDAREQVDALSQNLGVSRLAVIDIGLKSQSVTQAYKDQLTALRGQAVEQAALAAYQDSWVGEAQRRAAAEARAQEMLRQRQQLQADEAEASRVRELERIEALRLVAEEERLAGIKIVEVLEDQKKKRETIVEEQVAVVQEALQEEITLVEEAVEERIELEEGYATAVGSIQDSLVAARQAQEEEETARLAEQLQARKDMYAGYAATVRDISRQLTDAILDFGSSLYDQQAQWIEENVEDEEERDRQIRALRRKEAQTQKLLGAFNIFVSTAEAIMKFLAGGNVPLAVIAGATGAIQLAAVLAKPLPQLAQGGIIPATPGGRAVIAGEGGSAEAVVPLDQIGRFMSDINRGGGAGGDTRVIVNLDGKPIIDTVAKASRNRTLLIDARAVVA